MTPRLLILLFGCILAAFLGVQAALWQVPPDWLEEPPVVPIGANIPMPAETIISADPAALRDYHFTLASGGDAGKYLEDHRVRPLHHAAPTASNVVTVKLQAFDADLARITLPAASPSPETSYVLAEQLIQAHERQKSGSQ